MIVTGYVMAEIYHHSIVTKNLTQVSSVTTLVKRGPAGDLTARYRSIPTFRRKPFKCTVFRKKSENTEDIFSTTFPAPLKKN